MFIYIYFLYINKNECKIKNIEDKMINNEKIWTIRTPMDPNRFFMAAAIWSSQRSKNPHWQNGAVLGFVDEEGRARIVGAGYNGLTHGMDDHSFDWNRSDIADYEVCSVRNAILNRNMTSLENTILYVTDYPSRYGAKEIVKMNIKTVYYRNLNFHNETSFLVAKRVLEAANVSLIPYVEPIEIELNFERFGIIPDVQFLHSFPSSLKSFLDKRSKARKDAISWDEYFFGMAILAFQLSEDPSTQVGCCIVDSDYRIVKVSANTFHPTLIKSGFQLKKVEDPLEDWSLYIDHSESASLDERRKDFKGCKAYVSLFPCNECAKLLIQSGITEINYLSDKNKKNSYIISSKEMLKVAKIKTKLFRNDRKRFIIQ